MSNSSYAALTLNDCSLAYFLLLIASFTAHPALTKPATVHRPPMANAIVSISIVVLGSLGSEEVVAWKSPSWRRGECSCFKDRDASGV